RLRPRDHSLLSWPILPGLTTDALPGGARADGPYRLHHAIEHVRTAGGDRLGRVHDRRPDHRRPDLRTSFRRRVRHGRRSLVRDRNRSGNADQDRDGLKPPTSRTDPSGRTGSISPVRQVTVGQKSKNSTESLSPSIFTLPETDSELPLEKYED